MTVATPFPWHALRRVARGEVRAARALSGLFPAISHAALERRLAELVATRVELRPRGRSLEPRSPAPRGPRCLLETDTSLRLAVDVDAELVLAVVGLLSGAKALPRVAVGRDVPAEVAGAVVGVLQWIGHGVGAELAPAEGAPRGPVLVVEASVEVGALRGRARISVEVPETDAGPTDDRGVLARLGETPLSARVVGHAGTAPAGLLARTGPGDVLIVPAAPSLRVGRQAFEATILAPEGGLRRVRVGGPSPALAAAAPPSEEGGPMSPNDESGATVEMAALTSHAGAPRAPELAQALAELPLEVQVELGTVTMTARAWSSFALGDVLVLDQRVGAPVGLRVSGRLIGRGELVEVDGSVGVRITERVG